jgi:hypothetical protein
MLAFAGQRRHSAGFMSNAPETPTTALSFATAPSTRPVALLRRCRPRRLVFELFQRVRHQPAEHRAQHGHRDKTAAAAFLRRAARHQKLRHDGLIDLREPSAKRAKFCSARRYSGPPYASTASLVDCAVAPPIASVRSASPRPSSRDFSPTAAAELGLDRAAPTMGQASNSCYN